MTGAPGASPPVHHVSGRPPGPRDLPPPSLPVLGVLCPEPALGREAAEAFAEPFGGVSLWGEVAPFDQTGYYAAEMGEGLQRFYCACGELVPAEDLPRLKWRAWEVEQRSLAGVRRAVNLDPGLLDHTKVVLASFKAGPQKLHLGGGVWADLVLYYSHGAYGPLPWTFPDLRGGDHLGFFAAARRRYKELLRRAAPAAPLPSEGRAPDPRGQSQGEEP